MSGPMPREVAEAASAAALLAEASARGVIPGIIIRERQQAAQSARESLGDVTWRSMPQPVRMLIVKYAAKDCTERPQDAALKPWRSFSDDDRLKMGAMARELQRSTKGAAYLV